VVVLPAPFGPRKPVSVPGGGPQGSHIVVLLECRSRVRERDPGTRSVRSRSSAAQHLFAAVGSRSWSRSARRITTRVAGRGRSRPVTPLAGNLDTMSNRRGSLLAFGLVFGGPLLLFLALAVEVREQRGPGWDTSVTRLLDVDASTPSEGRAAEQLLEYSPAIGAVLLGGLVLALAARRRIRDALFLTVAVAGVVLVEPLLKHAFERPSPEDAAGFSFPSGSAMTSMAAVAAVAVLAWPTRARWLVVAGGAAFVFAYGVAIVDQRWHYPSDVLAGWCLALVWVSLLWLLGVRHPSDRRLM
jgi:membrane-associated phospholipid phosphatase